MKRRIRFLKILSFAAAAALIWLILAVTNAFTGNPISSLVAKKAIERHVEQTYPDLALHIGKTSFNFKFHEYWAKASSETSPDTYFNVYYRNGKVQYDEYDSRVVGRMNTGERLEKQYSAHITPLLETIEGLSNTRAFVMLDTPMDEAREKLALDMKFEPNLPLNVRLNIYADMQAPSLSKMTDVLEQVHQRLLSAGCTFIEYSIDVQGDGGQMSASFVKPKDIESGELASRLETAWISAQASEVPDLKEDLKEDSPIETEHDIYVYIRKAE
ncbi:hypothetical protein [Paenibacillus sp. NPDC058071]|uniref:YfjL-like protein n=1 Tax=Paenibacillus sp. NPDC058071 TaxID=3346326 RepID=UPI0036D92616